MLLTIINIYNIFLSLGVPILYFTPHGISPIDILTTPLRKYRKPYEFTTNKRVVMRNTSHF